MTEHSKLNAKLAEWVGFKHTHFGTIIPEPKPYCYLCNPPNFTSSLDACFKWLVPELDGWELSKVGSLVRAGVRKGLYTGQEFASEASIALCKAIEQLIDKEQAE